MRLADERARRAHATAISDRSRMVAWIEGPEVVVQFPDEYERVRLNARQVRVWRDAFSRLLKQVEEAERVAR